MSKGGECQGNLPSTLKEGDVIWHGPPGKKRQVEVLAIAPNGVYLGTRSFGLVRCNLPAPFFTRWGNL